MVILFQCHSFSSILLLCNSTLEVSWILTCFCYILKLMHCIWKFMLYLVSCIYTWAKSFLTGYAGNLGLSSFSVDEN